MDIQKTQHQRPVYLILTLVPYPYGGGESFMHQTIDWLYQAGYDCVWVSFLRHINRKSSIRHSDHCIFHTYSGYPSDDRFEAIWTLYRPDIIHLQGPIVYLGVPFFLRYRVSLLVGFHFWTGIIKPTPDGGFRNRDILSRRDNLLDGLCQDQRATLRCYVASDFINQVIVHLGGRPIPNVIYPIPPKSHYTIETPIQDRLHITCVNINQGKGGDLFLDIVKQIKDLPFLAVCNEPNSGSLDRDILDQINGQVVSYVDITKIYAKTRILLIPSHVDETFSRVAYEGAANGIAIITTGKGFIRSLLGSAGIYLDSDPKQWVETIRDLYFDVDRLTTYRDKLQAQVAKLPSPKEPFLQLVKDLHPMSSKNNIMILAPWCDQGLGHQAKLYSQLLRQKGYRVHIFSYLSYFCLDRDDSFRHDPEEWLDYDSIYESYNTREEITERELRQFVMSRQIGRCLIPEICFNAIFDRARYLRSIHVECYAIPNIEICRQDELDRYAVFNKVLCNTHQCFDVLKSKDLGNIEYIGHCLPTGQNKLRQSTSERLRFLHVSGYNALTRKQTLTVIKAFRLAQATVGSQIELTITFSRNIPAEIFAYRGDGIDLETKSLSHHQILDLYQHHDISIQVSSHEGLGLGFYESIWAGTPIISLNQAPHNEAVVESRSGWLLPSTEMDLADNNQALVKGGLVSESDLANKIIHLACHRQEVEQVQKRIQQEKAKWSQGRFIDRLIDAISS